MKQFSFVPEVFTIDAAAHYLGVSERTVKDYIRSGQLKTYRLPARNEHSSEFLKRTHIRKEQLDAFIESGMTI